jgi:RNA polymerase sigma factor (sigma-70 family)
VSLPPTKPVHTTEHTRWFVEEVQPHASSLRSYLHGAFPAVHDVDDVVQESYLRVWKACALKPIRSARGFLFQVARRIALDFVRRESRSPLSFVDDLSGLPALEEGRGVDEIVGLREQVGVLAEAIDGLPARCREVVILRKLKQMPQREVAELLGLSEKTVESHLARGVKRCEDFLMRRGIRAIHHHEND